MTKSGSGRCLCRKITFEFGSVAWAAHCHCDSCRRNTSSPLTSFIGVPRGTFRYLSGAPRAYLSSPGVTRWFCPDCGSPLAYDADQDSANIHLYIASLDDPAAIAPGLHVFYAEKLPWLTVDDDLPKYETTPGATD